MVLKHCDRCTRSCLTHMSLKVSGNAPTACTGFAATTRESTVKISDTHVGVHGSDTSAFLDSVQLTAAPVPEPGTMMLLGAGMGALAIYGKRRKQTRA
jgi:hypothetical protein